jgi:hypothetical protein
MGGYPGSFPLGFLNRVDEMYGIYGDSVLFPYGGAMREDFDGSDEWVINDINPDLGQTTEDACDPPDEWSDSFDVVLADPPYGEEYAEDLYDVEYQGPKKIYKGSAECVAPGGYLLILDHLVYVNYSTKKGNDCDYIFERENPVAITTGPNTRVRVLNVFKRVE